MSEKVLQDISDKLDIIVRLIASKSIEEKSKTDSIVTLGTMGLDGKLIAEVVGTTTRTVSTRLSEAKKKAKARGK